MSTALALTNYVHATFHKRRYAAGVCWLVGHMHDGCHMVAFTCPGCGVPAEGCSAAGNSAAGRREACAEAVNMGGGGQTCTRAKFWGGHCIVGFCCMWDPWQWQCLHYCAGHTVAAASSVTRNADPKNALMQKHHMARMFTFMLCAAPTGACGTRRASKQPRSAHPCLPPTSSTTADQPLQLSSCSTTAARRHTPSSLAPPVATVTAGTPAAAPVSIRALKSVLQPSSSNRCCCRPGSTKAPAARWCGRNGGRNSGSGSSATYSSSSRD
mgnify:CR=1 FL=1